MTEPTGYVPRVYTCQCGRNWDEDAVGMCRMKGFEKLFCTMCGSINIKMQKIEERADAEIS